MKNYFAKAATLLLCLMTLFSGAVIPLDAKAEARKITARHYDRVKIDGEADEVWKYAESQSIDVPVGSYGVTASFRTLYGNIGIGTAAGAASPNKCLYVLVEVDKHGTPVDENDTVYLSLDLLSSGVSTEGKTTFGIGIFGVTPVGEGLNFGWIPTYRGSEFTSASKQTGNDKWVAEFAIDIIDANTKSRDYVHTNDGKTVKNFGIGTEIAFSVIVNEDGQSLFSENNTVAWGSNAKRDFLIPKNRIVIGDDITAVAPIENKIERIGDIDGDGSIKGKDATTLLKHLAAWDVKITEALSDVNGDGKIRGSDATTLLKYLAGWDVKIRKNSNFGNVLILGDSISTFDGYIPDGYACAYFADSYETYQIDSVDDTWWYMLIEESGSTLVRNDSFSGSCIGYSSYNGNIVEGTSYVTRFDNLVKAGYFDENRIDTVFIHGGTNDFCANAPTGEIKYSSITKEDLKSTLPALSTLLSHIREALPNARIVLMINGLFPQSLRDGYARIGLHYGADCVQLLNIDAVSIHPNYSGMCQIKDLLMNLLY